MNKKQVVKVSFEASYAFADDTNATLYGIAIDNEQILTENAMVIDLENKNMRRISDERYPAEGNKRIRINEVSNTRNVPPALRKSLEDGLSAYIEYSRQLSVMREAEKAVKSLQPLIEKTMTYECNRARGRLSKQEFAEAFMDNLSPAVKNELRLVENKNSGYWHNSHPYRAEVENYGEPTLYLERDVEISKYYNKENEIVGLEYDNTTYIKSGAEKTKTYKDFVKKYSMPLSVKADKENHSLSMGDKDYLILTDSYEFVIKGELTEENAKKMAEKACKVKTRAKGRTKTFIPMQPKMFTILYKSALWQTARR